MDEPKESGYREKAVIPITSAKDIPADKKLPRINNGGFLGTAVPEREVPGFGVGFDTPMGKGGGIPTEVSDNGS